MARLNQIIKHSVLLSSCLAIYACGGSGGGLNDDVEATPTPVVTATPTPTSTATPTPTTSPTPTPTTSPTPTPTTSPTPTPTTSPTPTPTTSPTPTPTTSPTPTPTTSPTPTPTTSPTPTPTTSPTPTPTPTPTPGVFVGIQQYDVYVDALNGDLQADYWDNGAGTLTIDAEVAEDGRGNVMTIVKPEDLGNVFFIIEAAQDLNYWVDSGKIEFDVRVNSGSTSLSVKMDSGYPAVSSFTLNDLTVGEWTSISIPVADLEGSADFAAITNMLVFEPAAAASVSLDNIRFVQPFAPMPSYTLYDDALNTDLNLNSWDNETGAVTISEVADGERGTVYAMNFSSNIGNAFIGPASGSEDLSHWSELGKIVFDMKVESGTATTVDIKIDSGYPDSSSTTLTPSGNEWETYEVYIADLLEANEVDMLDLVNMFVIEPVGGSMNLLLDNIRWEMGTPPPAGVFAPLPSFIVFDDATNANLVLGKWDNNTGNVNFTVEEETDRGQVVTMDKVATTGNMYFTINGGPKDVSHWSAEQITFDFRINSNPNSADVLIKIDSQWPNVSGIAIPAAQMANIGVWQTMTVNLSDLTVMAENPADLANLTNMFVVEPTDTLNISVDNIRWEASL